MTARSSTALRLPRLFLMLFAGATLGAGELFAQGQNYGAPFLLLPTGAHAVGQSDAVVADSALGGEGIWWNPSALARMRKPELAIHHSQTFAATSEMVSFVYPSRLLGTFAAAANVVDYGGGGIATDSTGAVLGTIVNRNYLFVASYAAPIGRRLNVGLSAKLILQRLGCAGCGVNVQGSTNAIDFGAQYTLPSRIPITFGASVRNLGQPLQTKDAEQADPLPPVVQVGARVRVPIAALDSNDTSLDVLSDVFSSPAYSGPSIRVGAVLTYSKDYVLRVGYKTPAGVGDNQGGFSVGLGLTKGSIGLDFARRFDSTSQLGTAPTYVSLRFTF
ncbi:MAG: PorV/PorQ family protein [Gemmatimonadota bacterium]|nr:PorV/PorQ family protein [Gemmatimonadota bacterium]